jgi:hypothetical protein
LLTFHIRWVSSVRGAVIHGVAKNTLGFEGVKLAPQSWGVKLDPLISCPAFPDSKQGQIIWQMWKDDIVLSRYRPRHAVVNLEWRLEDLNPRKFNLTIAQSNRREAQISEPGVEGNPGITERSSKLILK